MATPLAELTDDALGVLTDADAGATGDGTSPTQAVAGGAGALLKATVVPPAVRNLQVDGVMVKVVHPLTGAERLNSGRRLRTAVLLPQDSNQSRYLYAAVRDANGAWSEWSRFQPFNFSGFAAGAAEASIGSGAAAEAQLEEPGVAFPDLALGSGQGWVHRTLVSEGFVDQTARAVWPTRLAVFHVKLDDLDMDQETRLQAFWRAMGGPHKPFVFDYVDPATGASGRYVVRFRDPEVAATLFTTSRSEMSFVLVQVMDQAEGSTA